MTSSQIGVSWLRSDRFRQPWSLIKLIWSTLLIPSRSIYWPSILTIPINYRSLHLIRPPLPQKLFLGLHITASWVRNVGPFVKQIAFDCGLLLLGTLGCPTRLVTLRLLQAALALVRNGVKQLRVDLPVFRLAQSRLQRHCTSRPHSRAKVAWWATACHLVLTVALSEFVLVSLLLRVFCFVSQSSVVWWRSELLLVVTDLLLLFIEVVGRELWCWHFFSSPTLLLCWYKIYLVGSWLDNLNWIWLAIHKLILVLAIIVINTQIILIEWLLIGVACIVLHWACEYILLLQYFVDFVLLSGFLCALVHLLHLSFLQIVYSHPVERIWH